MDQQTKTSPFTSAPYVAGMERPLPDVWERLQRRSSTPLILSFAGLSYKDDDLSTGLKGWSQS